MYLDISHLAIAKLDIIYRSVIYLSSFYLLEMIIIFRDYFRSHTEARDRFNQIKEEILAKVGSENRAGYVQMKEEEYGDFFEEIIKRAEDEASN